jgi:hypothetical protein
MTMVFHGNSPILIHTTNPSCISVPNKQCIPARYYRTASLQDTDTGQLHDWGIQPELKPRLDMITEQVFKFSWSGKACLHWSVWFNTMFWHDQSACIGIQLKWQDCLSVKYHCHTNNICILHFLNNCLSVMYLINHLLHYMQNRIEIIGDWTQLLFWLFQWTCNLTSVNKFLYFSCHNVQQWALRSKHWHSSSY